MAKEIGIHELIERVKDELLANSSSTPSLFFIEKIELAIQFTVERSMNGGINLQVVQTGVDKKASETQTITVTLSPIVEKNEASEKLDMVKRALAAGVLMRSDAVDSDSLNDLVSKLIPGAKDDGEDA